jgi:hypothetical protein
MDYKTLSFVLLVKQIPEAILLNESRVVFVLFFNRAAGVHLRSGAKCTSKMLPVEFLLWKSAKDLCNPT